MLYSTQIMMKYDIDVDIDFRKSLDQKINLDMYDFSKYIKLITLSMECKDEKNKEFYEYSRDEFIKKLKKLNIYASIQYDSLSFERHKYISSSIYDLERNFRNLIEIIFLNECQKKLTELPVYKDSNAKSKKENREEVVQALENPLDDLDFIKLSKFISENVTLDNNKIIVEKLDEINDNIINLAFNNNSDSSIDKLHKEIDEIKERIVKPDRKKLSASIIFNHLTKNINDEWNRLYKIRNLWAHNNCLITKNEFEEYKKLYKKVSEKVETELTILTFFKDEEKVREICSDDQISLNIKMYEIHGRGNCQLELTKNYGEKSLIIDKNCFVYKDFNKLFNYFCLNELIELNKNPIMLFNCQREKLNEFENKLANIEEEKLKEFVEKNNEFKINEIEGDAGKVSKEISECLETIFTDKK